MGSTSKIEFVRATAPIAAAVTKFGGQPNWVAAPQWPLSRETGRPMRFIAQIALAPPEFSGSGKVAYVFMTDDDDEYVDGTWDPDSGENAVVIQPGRYAGPVEPLDTGPSLFEMVDDPDEDQLQPEPVEFSVRLTRKEEPDFASEDVRESWSEQKFERYADALEGNKIGGAPLFIQGDELPDGDGWKLLLQLDSADVPFSVNFGDAGIGYVFIDADESTGRFVWQCA